MSEKNKMDYSQNGYSSVEKTGKIKKNDFVLGLLRLLSRFELLVFVRVVKFWACLDLSKLILLTNFVMVR